MAGLRQESTWHIENKKCAQKAGHKSKGFSANTVCPYHLPQRYFPKALTAANTATIILDFETWSGSMQL